MIQEIYCFREKYTKNTQPNHPSLMLVKRIQQNFQVATRGTFAASLVNTIEDGSDLCETCALINNFSKTGMGDEIHVDMVADSDRIGSTGGPI